MQLSIGWALGGAGTSLPLSQGPLGFALEPDLFSVLISVQLYQLFPSTSSCKRKRSKKKNGGKRVVSGGQMTWLELGEIKVVS